MRENNKGKRYKMKITIQDGSEIEKTNLAYQIAKILKPNHKRIVQVIPLISNTGQNILVDNELERKKRNVPPFIEIENTVEELTNQDLVIFDGCIIFPSKAKTEILTVIQK
jgi:hypothetical protein